MPRYNKSTGALEAPKEPTMSAPTAALESVTYGCLKCCGSGRLPTFRHIENGVCFTCGGTGLVTSKRRPVDVVPVIDPNHTDKKLSAAQVDTIRDAVEEARDYNEALGAVVWYASISRTRRPDGADYTLWVNADEIRTQHGENIRVGLVAGRVHFTGRPGAWADVRVSGDLCGRITKAQAAALLDAIAR